MGYFTFCKEKENDEIKNKKQANNNQSQNNRKGPVGKNPDPLGKRAKKTFFFPHKTPISPGRIRDTRRIPSFLLWCIFVFYSIYFIHNKKTKSYTRR